MDMALIVILLNIVSWHKVTLLGSLLGNGEQAPLDERVFLSETSYDDQEVLSNHTTRINAECNLALLHIRHSILPSVYLGRDLGIQNLQKVNGCL